MKALKIIAAVFIIGYPVLVIAFETWLGLSQPVFENTIVIATTDDKGVRHDRVVTRLESNDKTYVAVNHWPRAWYYRVLENPNIAVTINDQTNGYTAIEVSGPEHDKVQHDNPTGIVFRLLTGFPPRYFIRLDPV